MTAHLLVALLDLGGTFVFAISGAMMAVRHRMDGFGVIVLAFAAGNAGGIARDLLIGAVPPAAILSWHYVAVSAAAGLSVYFWPGDGRHLIHPIQWLDAVGLSFFAVAGAEKALIYGLDPIMAALLGMLTGVGGGMLRDILANEIPAVLKADLYALAALAGAAIVAFAESVHADSSLAAIWGAGTCFILRYMAIRHGWHLPAARRGPRP